MAFHFSNAADFYYFKNFENEFKGLASLFSDEKESFAF
jgi:hypothetical protein